MSVGYRHADRRYPPLWATAAQPAGRWHAAGTGPAHYLADTPDGAWAEFLRHEGITDPADLAGVERALWVFELPAAGYVDVAVPAAALDAGEASVARCRAEAARLRAAGAAALRAPSAALVTGGATGRRVEGEGVASGPSRDGVVYVLYGPQPALVGWCAAIGRPEESLVARVRHG